MKPRLARISIHTKYGTNMEGQEKASNPNKPIIPRVCYNTGHKNSERIPEETTHAAKHAGMERITSRNATRNKG